MPKNQKTAPFDAQAFFEAMGPGQTASKHQPQDVIFCQGDRADSVFYVQSGKVKRMNNDISDYERLCDEELVAADLADSKDARIAHLEQAFRFAKKASTERAALVVSAHVSA